MNLVALSHFFSWMKVDYVFPADLVEAAHVLERRLRILQIPTRRVNEAEWNSLPERIKLTIPLWLQTFLCTYSLSGAVLELRDPKTNFPRPFSFFEPEEYVKILQEGSLYWPLIQSHFFPFANEADGNAWLADNRKASTGAINLLALSDWNGSQPTKENGLVLQYATLPILLTAMAVSGASF